MGYDTLKVEKTGAIARVTLNRPPVNAINSQVIADLRKLALNLNQDGETKVALLIGAEKNFAAGADIKEIAALAPGDEVSTFASRGHEAFLEIERGEVLFVALIRGFCLGGGCELAMACHLRVADRTAVFGQPEIKLGICPGFGASQRLPHLIGRPRALYMLTTGDQLDAARAYDWRLADLLVPEGETLEDFGNALAGKMAFHGRPSLIAAKELINYSHDFDMEQGYIQEAEMFGDLSRTEDMREGFAAFIEKRKADFKNR